MGLGSEIRDPEKPILDPGSRGQKGTGSWIRIRNTDKYRYLDFDTIIFSRGGQN